MFWKILGDLILAVHATWVLAVLFLPFWVWRRPRGRAIHMGMMGLTLLFAVFLGGCPLTFLENRLWEKAGEAVYPGSFLSHYLWELVYYDVSQIWITLAAALWFAFWCGIYSYLWAYRRKKR